MNERDILVGADAVRQIANAIGKETRGGLESAGADDEMARVRRDLPEAVDVIEREDRRDGLMVAPEHQVASLLQSFLEERAAENADDLLAREQLRPARTGGLEAKFDERDVAGWVAEFFPAWLKTKFSGKRPFLPPRDTVVALKDDARIALLGDWGSGLYGAPVCADSIRRAAPAYDLVMHLGDVYYAGTADEVRARFLDAWPRVPGAKHRALNSNHEMYSGGEGYFDLTLKDGDFAQSSSCFALQTSRLLLLGLDTAYEDHDLNDTQVAWVRRRVAGAEGRKVVFFSHHQPFSQFEGGGQKLLNKLGDLLDARKAFAWYWGHEHRCAFYARHEPWGLWGRCIGHGGYPAFRDSFETPGEEAPDGSRWHAVKRRTWPVARVLDGPNPYVVGHEARYAPNGYVTLVLDEDRIHELVHAPDGTVLLTNTIA